MIEQILPLLGGALLCAAVGALVLWLGSACRRGALKRNRLLGMRTPATLRSDRAWVVAHRAAAPQITTAGWGIVAAPVVAAALTPVFGPVPVVPLAVVVGFVWAFGWIIAGGIVASRAARSIRLEQGRDSGSLDPDAAPQRPTQK